MKLRNRRFDRYVVIHPVKCKDGWTELEFILQRGDAVQGVLRLPWHGIFPEPQRIPHQPYVTYRGMAIIRLDSDVFDGEQVELARKVYSLDTKAAGDVWIFQSKKKERPRARPQSNPIPRVSIDWYSVGTLAEPGPGWAMIEILLKPRSPALARDALRDQSQAVRVASPRMSIDPGFINRRKVLSVLGERLIAKFNELKAGDDQVLGRLQNDHLLVRFLLGLCARSQVPSLGLALANPQVGQIVASNETILGTKRVYEDERIRVQVVRHLPDPRKVWVELSTRHIVADTGRLELSQRSLVALVGLIRSVSSDEVVIQPFVIGAPTFESDEDPEVGAWRGLAHYQVFVEDFDQFARVKGVERPRTDQWKLVMGALSEHKVKESFASLLGEQARKDWGGETSDHFSSSISLGGKRTTAAFLFKGPSRFAEMTPKHLGRQGDQVVRLASTDAQVLIVQHAHLIGEAVRQTLRAFAVSPGNPRHYCCIDGPDTFRLLTAYNLI